jgi:hypothetical protein
VTFDLNGAPFVAATYVIMGVAELNAPFKQGTLVPDPSPPSIILPLVTDATGSLTLQANWPPGVPSGVQLFVQAWSVDPNGPAGFAASNAVRVTVP